MLSDFFDKTHICISSNLNKVGLLTQLFIEIVKIYIDVNIYN